MSVAHSFLPPSGAESWSRCALWPTMNTKFPEADKAAADEGTAAHWVAFTDPTPAEGTLAPNGIAVTDEMIEGAALVQETIERIEALGFFGKLHIEETIRIPWVHKDCFGTPDIWSYSREQTHLEIFDYKYGHRFVDEYWNPQGLLYMVGICDLLPSLPEFVSFTIIQPRCYYRGQAVRTHTYKLKDSEPHLTYLRNAAFAASLPQPVATTGLQCEHCPGRHACPTLQRAAYSDAETSTNQPPVELSPEAAALELRMLERALVRLSARVDGLREQTMSNIKAGKRVPHYKAETGRKRRVWKATPDELKLLSKLTGKSLVTEKLLTPTQAEQLSLAPEIISRYTHYIDGALKLVEVNDKEATRIFSS